MRLSGAQFLRNLLYQSWLVVLLLCGGCNDNTLKTQLTDYTARLERVTNTEASKNADGDSDGDEAFFDLAFPRQRERRMPELGVQTSLFAVMDLTHCELQQVMAQRTGPLGKVMQPPVALIYAFDVRDTLQRCLFPQSGAHGSGSSEGEVALTETQEAFLADLVAQKRAHVSNTLWNLTFGASVFDQITSQAGARLSVSEAGSLLAEVNSWQGTVRAIDRLAFFGEKLLQGEYHLTEADRAEVYAAYQQLERSNALGALVRIVTVYIEQISRATALLNGVSPQRFCPQGKPIERVRVLQRVVVRYFGQEIQQTVAPIDRRGLALLQSIQRLIALYPMPLAPPQERFATYWARIYGNDGSLWVRFRHATKAHAKAASGLLARCGAGVMPQDTVPGS
jgi:hypothetical protein